MQKPLVLGGYFLIYTRGQPNPYWNFSFKVAAIWNSSIEERVSGSVRVKYTWDGVDYNIGSARTFAEGSTISVTDAVSGGLSGFAYDMSVPVKLVFTSLATTYDAL